MLKCFHFTFFSVIVGAKKGFFTGIYVQAHLSSCPYNNSRLPIGVFTSLDREFQTRHCFGIVHVSIFHHHHHVALVARISLILSRHSSLSFIALGRSSGQHPVSSHSCWMYVRAGRPAFAQPCVGVHKSTFLMSSSLLLQ